MAKINLQRKVENGGTTAAGRLSPTEAMQIADSTDALYDGLYTGGTIGTIKSAALPNVDLMPLFDPAFFKVGTNGLLQPIDAPSSGTTPTAPTMTLTGRQFSFVHPTYTGQLEVSTNNGSWVAYTDNAPLPNPAVSTEIAANYYRARVKADPGTDRNAGAIVGNTYLAAEGGGGGELVGLTDYAQLDNITLTGNSQSHVAAGSLFGLSRSTLKIASGAPFEIRFDADLLQGSGVLMVGQGTDITPTYTQIATIYWARNTNTNGRFKGATLTDELNDYSDVTVSGPTPKGRIRGTGTRIYVEKSFNDGATWTEIAATPVINQPVADMWVKTFFDQSYTKSIPNILVTGLS